MSEQKDKSKDKNYIRISEDDIQKKLYGDHNEPKNKEKAVKGKFSEDLIKNKLYGDLYQPQKENIRKVEPAVPAAPVSNDLFTQKKTEPMRPEPPKPESIKPLQAKPEKIKMESPQPAQPDTAVPEPEIKILPVFQEEISALKQAISNLEDKLQKTEMQKHKLKVKLVQKRKLINIREGLADLVLNKMPEKFIMLFFALIILFSVLIFVKLMPKHAAGNQHPAVAAIPVEKMEATVKPEQRKTVVKAAAGEKITVAPPEPLKTQAAEPTRRFTIQVAEYADEKAATDFVQELKTKGFDVYINTIYRGPNNTRPYFKINVGSFDSFNDAKNYNDDFREKTKITDSFIRESK